MHHPGYYHLPEIAHFIVGGNGFFQADDTLLEAIWKRLQERRSRQEILPEPLMLVRDEENSNVWYLTCFQQSENQEKQK